MYDGNDGGGGRGGYGGDNYRGSSGGGSSGGGGGGGSSKVQSNALVPTVRFHPPPFLFSCPPPLFSTRTPHAARFLVPSPETRQRQVVAP